MKKRMKKNNSDALKIAAGLLVVAFIIFLAGCDTFEEDNVKAADKLETEKTLFFTPNSSVIVDFRTLIKVNGVIKTEITKEPQYGKLAALGEELYKYSPFTDNQAPDQIHFNVYDKDNRFLFSDILKIKMVTDPGDSCFLYAAQDEVFAFPGETKTIDVLANDVVCDSVVDISILKHPEYGTVSVRGSAVAYYSNGFEGVDEFVYRLKEGADARNFSDALVKVTVAEDTCLMQAVDDYVTVDYNHPDTALHVLNNDTICGDTVLLEIVEPPYGGTAWITSGNDIAYLPENSGNYQDALRYQACSGGICSEATVFIDVTADSCVVVDAVDDYVSIADTTSTGTLSIHVLNNDSYCDTWHLKIVEGPLFGTAYVQDSLIRYETGPDTEADQLVYELCSGDQAQCDQARVTIL